MFPQAAILLLLYLHHADLSVTKTLRENATETRFDDLSMAEIGGRSAGIGQFPYQISLQLNYSHICGGSILNTRYIITAGHCVYYRKHRLYPTSLLTVVVGTNNISPNLNLTRYGVEQIKPHPDFNRKYLMNDISLIKTLTSIEYSSNVQPINYSADFIGGQVPVTISGYGFGNANKKLKYLDTMTLTNWQCYVLDLFGKQIDETQICTQTLGRGHCYGDSGGPLVLKSSKKLVGIISWGFTFLFTNFCDTIRPIVYTRISPYVDWISANLR